MIQPSQPFQKASSSVSSLKVTGTYPSSVFIFITAAPLVRLNIFALGHRRRANRNEAAFIRLAKRIKAASFRLARLRWPKAKIFSLTSGAAVMKMNTELGYVPVTFNELTDDEAFWKGCEGCINHDILVAKNRKFCICTAMLYDPALHEEDTI